MKNIVTEHASALKISEEKQEEVVNGEPGNEDPAAEGKEASVWSCKNLSYILVRLSKRCWFILDHNLINNPSRFLLIDGYRQVLSVLVIITMANMIYK